MKRIFSIVLLGVFLFQFFGYSLVFMGLRYQAKSDMISRLDTRSYSSSETITLKIPFTLPYWADSKDYNRVDGDFQYQGQFYKLVEEKLEKDTLYVVCIKDVTEKQLNDSMSDYIKLANDLPTSSKQTLKLLSLIKDFVPVGQVEMLSYQGWALQFTYEVSSFSNLTTRYFPVFSPPPEHIG